jgi:excisionase family DNA binding protein
MDSERPLKIQQAAIELNLSVACLRAWIAQRRISFIRLGRSIRIPRTEIERVIEAGTVPARVRRNGN